MSNRWPGGLIRKTPVTPAGPFQSGAAPGMWSLADAAYWTKQGLWPTAGNFLAVEDVFSTWLYTGTGAAQTITNGIDLAGKGGMVWIKSRSTTGNNFLFDTTRGVNVELNSNTTDANATLANSVTAFNSNGFAISSATGIGVNAITYASWTFREAPKFFDVVTYTGNGANRNIAHSLGVAPGCIIVKRTNAAANWQVYHRSNANTEYMVLNTTAAKATGTTRWNSTTPTATEFTVGTDTTVNASGGTYVAYLFAHDATSDGIIQCGSFTTDASGNATVNLGWEPQWVLYKSSSSLTNWYVQDNMRGLGANALVANSAALFANAASAEGTGYNGAINSTGFSLSSFGASATMVYVAIRRGPMKTPTLGTSVFSPLAVTPVTGTVRTTGFPVDLSIAKTRTLTYGSLVTDRLRGFVNSTATNPPTLVTASTNAETTATYSSASYAFDNTGYKDGPELNGGYPTAYWNFRRAPGFFDEVCYTGTGVARTISHNLGAVPELMIVKARTATGGGINPSWAVYSQATGNTKALFLDQTSTGATNINYWNNTTPTSSVFSVFQADATNASATNYVAYLFASAPGVSKVGSYTGNGSSQTIDCGFTTGARFVLIKRTDNTGDWYVWDSARGIVAGNDPYLLLNSTAAEVTSTDYVDTDNSGFQLSSTAPAALNANGGSYIFLAIA